jgi:hypothetical protein
MNEVYYVVSYLHDPRISYTWVIAIAERLIGLAVDPDHVDTKVAPESAACNAEPQRSSSSSTQKKKVRKFRGQWSAERKHGNFAITHIVPRNLQLAHITPRAIPADSTQNTQVINSTRNRSNGRREAREEGEEG